MNKITITVEGGCVQGVEGIPPGVVVEIHDYDFEDQDDPVVQTWFSEPDSGLSKQLSELETELLTACVEFVKHIRSLPEDTEKCRILRLALNNRPGEMMEAAIAKATKTP